MYEYTTKEQTRRSSYASWSQDAAPAFCSQCGSAAQSDHIFCPRCGASLRREQTYPRRQGGSHLPSSFPSINLEAILRHPGTRPLLYAAGTIFALLLMVEVARALAGLAIVALIIFIAVSWVRNRERRYR